MRRYELTDRGKIIIAVVLVVVLLVIPSIIILAVTSCNDTSQPDTGPPSSQIPDDSPPVISNSPLPTPGSGFDPSPSGSPEASPPQPPEASPSPSPSPEASPSPSPSEGNSNGNGGNGNGNGDNGDVQEYGPVGLNIAEGTMSFIYSPDVRDTLDEETIEMLSEFLSSPRKTGNTIIKVEMPRVSGEDEEVLVAVISKAFSQYNITEDGLVYEMSSVAADSRYFEIALSYTPISNRK